MSFRPTAQSLIAPNIFDAYANPNLLLYLIAGNLLSPATWDLSSKIQQRALAAVGDNVPTPRLLVKEIQNVIDRNFRHLHTAEVVRLYGEIEIEAEERQLGAEIIDVALAQILRLFEARVQSGSISPEAIQPTIDRIGEGYFPAYFYGNIDLIRANKKLVGTSHASVKGLTSCVDETAIFAALGITIPRGFVANVIALASPSHTSAFGWNSDGEPWWFYGKNRLFFADDWQNFVQQEKSSDPQVAFDHLMSDMCRIISVAGTFNLDTGESQLPEDHVDEIVTKLDQFFGVRLQQVDEALSKPRRSRSEDPIAPCLRELMGSRSMTDVSAMLASVGDQTEQDVLYSYRSLLARDIHPYLVVARKQPNSQRLAETLSNVEEALQVIIGIMEGPSILGSHDRIAMPDETLRFRMGTDRDKALLLHVLAEHISRRSGGIGQVRTHIGEKQSFVCLDGRWFDAATGQLVEWPAGPILHELA
jgi:hypothetical protein